MTPSQHASSDTSEITKEVKPFECKICGKAFPHVDSLFCHIGSAHEKYKCDFCKKGFLCKEVLENHVLEVHSKKQSKKAYIPGAMKTEKNQSPCC